MKKNALTLKIELNEIKCRYIKNIELNEIKCTYIKFLDLTEMNVST